MIIVLLISCIAEHIQAESFGPRRKEWLPAQASSQIIHVHERSDMDLVPLSVRSRSMKTSSKKTKQNNKTFQTALDSVLGFDTLEGFDGLSPLTGFGMVRQLLAPFLSVAVLII